MIFRINLKIVKSPFFPHSLIYYTYNDVIVLVTAYTFLLFYFKEWKVNLKMEKKDYLF